jgi:hypothetical protein
VGISAHQAISHEARLLAKDGYTFRLNALKDLLGLRRAQVDAPSAYGRPEIAHALRR